MDDFLTCYHPENRHDWQATWTPDTTAGRWRVYTYEDLMQRDKVGLDLFWLRDESAAPPPSDQVDIQLPPVTGMVTPVR